MVFSAQEQQQATTAVISSQIGHGKAFGTFGELLQGRLPNKGGEFLVTLPIDCYSYATFVYDPQCTHVTAFPAEKQKSQALAMTILTHYGLPVGGRLIVQSTLPTGKGLASSSADLVATARALCSCFSLDMPPALLARLMCQIEPSDGVMYPGVVSFDHRRGHLHAFLGTLPSLTILGIDEGGEIDTVEFNKRPRSFTVTEERAYQRLLEILSDAVRQQNSALVAHVATQSALLNQQRNPKRTLSDVLAICEDIGGLGVVVAHSGTCLGLLLSRENPQYHEQVRCASAHLATITNEKIVTYYSFH